MFLLMLSSTSLRKQSHWLQQDCSWQTLIFNMSKQLYVCDGAYEVVKSPVVCKSVGNVGDT